MNVKDLLLFMLPKFFLVAIILIETIPWPWLHLEAERIFREQPFYNIAEMAKYEIEAPRIIFDKIKSLPVQKHREDPPKIKAKSVVLMDSDTAFILFEKNKDTEKPIASLAKIMTALIVLEKKKLSDVVTVGNEIYKIGLDESRMNLQIGERITVGNLIYGLLVKSAGDAAVVLAKAVAGSEQKFVDLMNKKAKNLGLKNSVFADSRGLSSKNQSTVFDLAILTNYALNNKTIVQIVKIKEITVYSVDKRFRHHLENTNKLILESNLPITGFKTGRTKEAGENLIATAQKNGRAVIVIILNSPSRFVEAEKLLQWFFNNYDY